jgi:hypothetical protein
MHSPSLFTIRRFHESTRRRWCRCALALFAFGPLTLLVGFSLVLATPWYRAWEKGGWEERVSATLGIDIRAETFRWTAPSQFRAEGVEVRHPETHRLLGHIERIDGLMKPQGWSVILDAPSIDGDQLNQGIDVVHDWFLCRPQTSSQLLALAIPKGLTIHHGIQKTVLNRIDVVFRPSSTVSAFHAKWILEDQPFGEVALQVSRAHSSSDSTTKMEISCPGVWIPCSLAADRFPFLRWMGQGSMFRGVIRYQESRRAWDAMVSGETQNLDFGEMTSSLGSPILGRGSLSLDELHVRDGRILKATGDFGLASGTISHRWVQHLASSLKLPCRLEEQSHDAVSLEQAALRFALDPSGILLTGTLPGPSEWPPIAARFGGSVLCADGTPIPIALLAQSLRYGSLADQSDSVSIAGTPSSISNILPQPVSGNDRMESPAATSLRFRLSRNADRSAAR